MQVVVREDCSVSYNYGVWPLVKGQILEGEMADYLHATGAPVDPVEPATEPEQPADDVPTGTVAEVLAWVDGDPDKAQLALDAEHARALPRVTLVADLEKLLAGG